MCVLLGTTEPFEEHNSRSTTSKYIFEDRTIYEVKCLRKHFLFETPEPFEKNLVGI